MNAVEATPIVNESQSIKDALIEMSAKGLGMTAVLVMTKLRDFY